MLKQHNNSKQKMTMYGWLDLWLAGCFFGQTGNRVPQNCWN